MATLEVHPAARGCAVASEAVQPPQPVEIVTADPAAPIDRRVLVALYEQHWASLIRTASWLVSDSALAEEIVQDSFIRLVEHWHELRDPGAAPAWLRRTVVNLSRSRIRRIVVGRHKTGLVGAGRPVADHSADRLGNELGDGDLGDAIRSLPRRQRECVVLRFVHDLTVNEIASTLKIGAGSVKTHLHRALGALGEAIQNSQATQANGEQS